jgi:hypothetical protein
LVLDWEMTRTEDYHQRAKKAEFEPAYGLERLIRACKMPSPNANSSLRF